MSEGLILAAVVVINRFVSKGCIRLVAVAQLNKANDCCYPEQSLRQGFSEVQLYTSKLPLESDDHQVTALACADLVLSTHCGRSQDH